MDSEKEISEKLKAYYLQLTLLHSDPISREDLRSIEKMIETNPLLIPHVMNLCSRQMLAFQDKAKKQQDHLLREALGDAVHLLGMTKKPRNMSKLCTRIRQAIFPKGITDFHHEGEKNFFVRYLEGTEE